MSIYYNMILFGVLIILISTLDNIGEIEIVVVHIDDLVITSNIEELMLSCKIDLKKPFDMADLGLLHYYLILDV